MKNGPEGPLITWCLSALATRNQETPSTLYEKGLRRQRVLLDCVPGKVLALVGSMVVVLHAVFVAADLSI